ncbi:hypothetical protein [Pseudomonas sp. NPDC087639]|uniref:hypothetical protein n=1 Tax=Pseudomonas sp. NPDC087639 TaxID=3364445 RepID=UPI0037F38A25
MDKRALRQPREIDLGSLTICSTSASGNFLKWQQSKGRLNNLKQIKPRRRMPAELDLILRHGRRSRPQASQAVQFAICQQITRTFKKAIRQLTLGIIAHTFLTV